MSTGEKDFISYRLKEESDVEGRHGPMTLINMGESCDTVNMPLTVSTNSRQNSELTHSSGGGINGSVGSGVGVVERTY